MPLVPRLRPQTKAAGAQTQNGTDATQRATGLASQYYGKPYQARTRTSGVEQMVTSTHDRNTWAYRAIRAIAANQARLPVIVRKGDPFEGKPLDTHPLLPLLNMRPNDFEDRMTFRYRLSAQLLTSTRGVMIEKILSRGGDTIGVQLLPPALTTPIPDKDTFVSAFRVAIGSVSWDVPADRVIWLRFPHPLDPYRSFTPAEAAGIAIDTDWLASLFQANWLRNDGRPGGLVSVKNFSGVPGDKEEIQSYFKSPGNAGGWRVIGADSISVAAMGGAPDAQYHQLREDDKMETLAAYGVGVTMIGDASGQTYANAEVDRKTFWLETMPEHLGFIAGGFDLVDGADDTWVDFDLSRVDVYQVMEEQRRAGLRAEFSAGMISPDQYMEETGRTPWGYRTTKALYLGMGQTPYAVEGEPDFSRFGGTVAARENPPAPPGTPGASPDTPTGAQSTAGEVAPTTPAKPPVPGPIPAGGAPPGKA